MTSWWWANPRDLGQPARAFTILIHGDVALCKDDLRGYQSLAGAHMLGGPNIIVLQFDTPPTMDLGALLRAEGFLPGAPHVPAFHIEARP